MPKSIKKKKCSNISRNKKESLPGNKRRKKTIRNTKVLHLKGGILIYLDNSEDNILFILISKFTPHIFKLHVNIDRLMSFVILRIRLWNGFLLVSLSINLITQSYNRPSFKISNCIFLIAIFSLNKIVLKHDLTLHISACPTVSNCNEHYQKKSCVTNKLVPYISIKLTEVDIQYSALFLHIVFHHDNTDSSSRTLSHSSVSLSISFFK